MRAVALLVLLLTTGCGPIEYLAVVTSEASRAVQEAKASRAPELAPYEYTAAVEYLQRAREIGGHADYHDAILFGAKARDFGRAAVLLAHQRAQDDVVPPKAPTAAGNF